MSSNCHCKNRGKKNAFREIRKEVEKKKSISLKLPLKHGSVKVCVSVSCICFSVEVSCTYVCFSAEQ